VRRSTQLFSVARTPRVPAPLSGRLKAARVGSPGQPAGHAAAVPPGESILQGASHEADQSAIIGSLAWPALDLPAMKSGTRAR
jgi:hypothetical protein